MRRGSDLDILLFTTKKCYDAGSEIPISGTRGPRPSTRGQRPPTGGPKLGAQAKITVPPLPNLHFNHCLTGYRMICAADAICVRSFVLDVALNMKWSF